ncbi:hypothetical protein SKAU_G00395080 [Synaphobranchus kaupii]|uniref:Uncharacterized protein n=1 Tax=Synaphobranchus kaupii TaxID=118154 RepID=A0A9Q1ID55_SYNKA|nr:hypothetical protein SKAU_G00395080 [Synaphobranchus kaupii]
MGESWQCSVVFRDPEEVATTTPSSLYRPANTFIFTIKIVELQHVPEGAMAFNDILSAVQWATCLCYMFDFKKQRLQWAHKLRT